MGAQYLNWQIDEVKLYAFWYMHRLHNSSSTSTADNGIEVGRGKCVIDVKSNTSGNGAKEDNLGEWTYQECILFDTLLATYDPWGDETDKVDQNYLDNFSSDRWKKISAMIPNKTASQCRK